LDERLGPDHPARHIAAAVDELDLGLLFDSYLGVGKRALRPDLLLKLVLYEKHIKRPSPADWTKDARENEPVRWLLFGLQPSRACLYHFRDRFAPFLPEWNGQTLHRAMEEDCTSATRASLDSTSVAAHAARRPMLNQERLEKRRQILDEELRRRQRGDSLPDKPGWLATTEAGLRQQQQRYQRAAEILVQRQAANAQRGSDKRKPADKVLVSPTDPEAILARDKLNVFRALYSVQLVRDLDSPLIFSYDVCLQNNDNGVLEPMIERMMDNVGVKPNELLIDSGYVSIEHLQFCDQAGITLYGPSQENDYSKQNGKKAQHNQFTALPKSAFVWLEKEQTYQCPEGHRLELSGTKTSPRADHNIKLNLYTCPPEHCSDCPRQKECTRTPQKGRTVSRMENEELLDELRARMQTPKAKQLYKLRSQTVELSFADMKEHRGLRRFHGRGLARAKNEVGTLVLVNNLMHVQKARAAARDRLTDETPKTLCSP
jgi:transposase